MIDIASVLELRLLRPAEIIRDHNYNMSTTLSYNIQNYVQVQSGSRPCSLMERFPSESDSEPSWSWPDRLSIIDDLPGLAGALSALHLTFG
jgi:hypothetical protein